MCVIVPSMAAKKSKKKTLKTAKNKASVTKFLAAVEDDAQRRDAKKLAKMMKQATGERAAMWGTSIVGFGVKSLEYADGSIRDWFRVGFAPRKGKLVVYIMPGFKGYGSLLRKLGKHQTGKSCLYIKKLDDVDLDVLQELIDASVA